MNTIVFRNYIFLINRYTLKVLLWFLEGTEWTFLTVIITDVFVRISHERWFILPLNSMTVFICLPSPALNLGGLTIHSENRNYGRRLLGMHLPHVLLWIFIRILSPKSDRSVSHHIIHHRRKKRKRHFSFIFFSTFGSHIRHNIYSDI